MKENYENYENENERDDAIVYQSVLNNIVSLVGDGLDYEVLLNDMPVVSTGDRAEAELISECIDIALNLLYIQKRLKIK